ncbi:hypothetical protein [Aureitalea marina]|uniref:Uncharacterized protein n=1 Tax=Aureitalea marina TaxID=930804 RepID=A0A2S7KNZ4_9FLAO|nr:hypothetical protein [Aureitalea marina]PQB04341.1 hypothetical protein BST85_05080 [Aureitalea marina]
MGIFSKKPKMDSRQKFLEIIRKEYSNLTLDQIKEELLDAVSIGVTDYYYKQYQRFRKQYPKSIKRYSSFHLKDLDHPTTHELIIKILKEKVGAEYKEPATKFLNMTLDEFKDFEKKREEFYNMF